MQVVFIFHHIAHSEQNFKMCTDPAQAIAFIQSKEEKKVNIQWISRLPTKESEGQLDMQSPQSHLVLDLM